MRGLLIVGVSLIALADRAAADDITVTKAAPISSSATSAYDWSGFYAGGHLGYAWGSSNWTASTPATTSSGSLNLYQPFDAFKGTGSFFEGLQAGYNDVLPNRVVIGAETDVSLPSFPSPQPVSASAALQRSRCRRSAHRATARTSLLSARCAAASVTRPAIGCFTPLAALPGPMISSPSPKPPRERASHRSCGGLAGQPEPASKCRSRHIGQRIWNICTPITAPQASDLSAGRSGSIPISRCRSCAPG